MKKNKILVIISVVLLISILLLIWIKISNFISIRKSGIELQYFSKSVRPQDYFYQYVNGQWLKTTKIPADESRWNTFLIVQNRTSKQLRQLIDSLAKRHDSAANSNAQKIVTLYNSYMNVSAINHNGLLPLQDLMKDVMQLKRHSQLVGLFARMNRVNVDIPMNLFIHQDAKDSNVMVADIYQGGLGLPDRDYYLQQTEKMFHIKTNYQKHITNMLVFVRYPHANNASKAIVHLETALAKIQWSRVKNRDPKAVYNKYTFKQLQMLAPNINWKTFNQVLGIEKKVNYLIISQPSYIKQLNELIQQTPLSVWRAYLTWHILNAYAEELPMPLYEEHFKFYGKQLMGIQKNQPRWKKALAFVENSIGEALGKFYVEDYFPLENKQQVLQLVHNLMKAYYQRIDKLLWMDNESKQGAKAKLNHLMVKIGYPNKWRNYSGLVVKKNDVIGNAIRANEFNYCYVIDKLSHPVDRSLWEITPQTVNAYYNPEKNEIVFLRLFYNHLFSMQRRMWLSIMAVLVP